MSSITAGSNGSEGPLIVSRWIDSIGVRFVVLCWSPAMSGLHEIKELPATVGNDPMRRSWIRRREPGCGEGRSHVFRLHATRELSACDARFTDEEIRVHDRIDLGKKHPCQDIKIVIEAPFLLCEGQPRQPALIHRSPEDVSTADQKRPGRVAMIVRQALNAAHRLAGGIAVGLLMVALG